MIMVASLMDIRTALANTIRDNMDADQILHVYEYVPEVPQLPACFVMPSTRETADFTGAMGKGLDTYFLDLVLLVSKSDYSINQDVLDQFVTGRGSRSVREIVFDNADLGMADPVDAFVSGVRGYGGRYEAAKIEHIGAIVNVTVRTTG